MSLSGIDYLVIGAYLLINFAYLSTLTFDAVQHAPSDRVATATLDVRVDSQPRRAPEYGYDPAAAKASELMAQLAELRNKIEKNCDYVGKSFPEEARKIHYGEAPERQIYGEASQSEAEELVEEGVDVALLPPDMDGAN